MFIEGTKILMRKGVKNIEYLTLSDKVLCIDIYSGYDDEYDNMEIDLLEDIENENLKKEMTEELSKLSADLKNINLEKSRIENEIEILEEKLRKM